MLMTECMRFTSLGHELDMHGNKACDVVNGLQLKGVAASSKRGLMEEERSQSRDELGSGGSRLRETAIEMLEFSGVEKRGRKV